MNYSVRNITIYEPGLAVPALWDARLFRRLSMYDGISLHLVLNSAYSHIKTGFYYEQ